MDPATEAAGSRPSSWRVISQGRPAQALTTGETRKIPPVSGFTHLYCSLMERAAYTASQIAEALDLPVRLEDLGEEAGSTLKTNRRWCRRPTGNNWAYFEARYHPLRSRTLWARPAAEPAFRTYELRRPRAYRLLEELKRRHGNTPRSSSRDKSRGFYNHFAGCRARLPDYGGLERASHLVYHEQLRHHASIS
jgi:broad specificity phosphatase PhoE